MSKTTNGNETATDPESTAKPYTTHPHKMGLKAVGNLDNIQELFSRLEGEDHL